MQKWIGSAAGALALLVSGAALAETPKLHPLEKLCVTYKMSGQIMNGEHEQCHRKWGYESYQIENTKIEMQGFSQTQKETTVSIGPTIYTIDREAGTGTKMQNPMYEGMVEAARDNKEGTIKAFAKAMGMKPTGKTEKILGHSCTVYAGEDIGGSCVTGDGIMLRMRVPQITMTATKVGKEAGDPAIYALPDNVRITEEPELPQNLQDMMKQYQQR